MYQTIILVGNLGRDPEMRYTPSGQAVTSLNVAVDDSYTDGSGQRVKRTIWFRISVWGKQAESCNTYLHKGSKVLVEGRLTPDPNTGGPRIFQRQDGTSGASFEIMASTVRFLSSKGEGSGGMGEEGAPEPAGEDEIPF
jgi:single-strand DNA-binding protein